MEKKYRVVCYMRIEPEDEVESLTYEEAVKEKEQGEFMQPENVYKIEEIENEKECKLFRNRNIKCQKK